MNVTLNGEPTKLCEGASAADAAATLAVEPGRGVAVAVDGEVVPRTQLAATPLREGQRVEVVVAIGGGCR